MKKILFSLACLSIGLTTFAQSKIKFQGQLSFARTQLNIDSPKLERAFLPQFGLSGIYSLNQKSDLDFAATFGFMGGTDPRNMVKHRTQYVGISGFYRYQVVPNVYLEGGVGLLSTIGYYTNDNSDTLQKVRTQPIQANWKLVPEVYLGTGLQFSPQFSAHFRYALPLPSRPWDHAMLTLQYRPEFDANKAKKEQKKVEVEAEVNRISKSVILVRIPDYQRQEAAFYAQSKELGDQFVANQQKTDSMIRRAFTDSFNLCPVYFFKGRYTDEIKQKKFTSLTDASGNSVTSSIPSDFWIVDFGTIDYDSTYDAKSDAYVYVGVVQGKSGLMVRSSDFVQMKGPFPFFVLASYSENQGLKEALKGNQTATLSLSYWNFNAMIGQFEKRLLKYYKPR